MGRNKVIDGGRAEKGELSVKVCVGVVVEIFSENGVSYSHLEQVLPNMCTVRKWRVQNALF